MSELPHQACLYQTYRMISLLNVREVMAKTSNKRDVGESPWQWIIDYISNIVNSHKPWYDLDGDMFGGKRTSLAKRASFQSCTDRRRL